MNAYKSFDMDGAISRLVFSRFFDIRGNLGSVNDFGF